MPSESPAAAQRQMRDMLDTCPARPRHYGLWGLAAGGTLLDGMSLAALSGLGFVVTAVLGAGLSNLGPAANVDEKGST